MSKLTRCSACKKAKMKMKKLFTVFYLSMLALSAQAQLNGTGFYRFRNAERTTEYISLTNDKFNFTTAIGTACGGLSKASSADGQARAMECVGRYLETDIHMVEDADCINPASVIYARKRYPKNDSDYDYNLIGQGTSLLTLTSGKYPSTYFPLTFQDRYITIKSNSGSGENTLYTAQIELKATSAIANLGIRYFVDNDGVFAINTSSSATNAKWYIEPVTHFNVQPEVEFNGKYYTTLYVPYAFTLSGAVENAYAVSAIADDGNVEVGETIASAGGTVPAGTPVILECTSDVAADCQLIPTGSPIFTAPDASVTSNAPTASTATNYTGTNILKGNYYCNQDGTMTFPTPSGTSSFNANHYTARTNSMYVLGITASGKLGFVKATGTAMPANKAWLEYTGTAELVLSFEEAAFVLGDVNRDGNVTIADVTALVNIILGKATEADNYDMKAANVNGDDDITIADVTALVNIILGKDNN